MYLNTLRPFVSLVPRFYLQNGFARLVALRGREARRPKRGQAPSIGKANAPTPKTSNVKFDFLRGKMLTHFILPESLIL